MRPAPVHLPGSPARRWLVVLALLVGGALVAAGCGGSSGGSSSGSPDSTAAPSEPSPSVATTGGAASRTTKPTIQDFAFHPDQLDVKVGQKVTWTNGDSTSHTVTADDGSFDSSGLAQGKSFTFSFDKPGTFAYHCSFHSNMTGSVVVS